MRRHRSLLVILALLAVAAVMPGAARAASAEEELVARYAPVLRLVAQTEPCGPGEPYSPLPAEAFLPDPGVALRGPWAQDDLIRVAPTADDLAPGLAGYHLDLPGDPLAPDCGYEEWSRAAEARTTPTTYARVASDPAAPGRIALQYWFLYAFNNFNNTHEGDWEMIQLDFDAPDATAALATTPALVGYSQHEAAESARWGSGKLTVVDGTHPVVYPAAGSHANRFTPALYLGASAADGVGCDDTRGDHRELRPAVVLLPGDTAAAIAAQPWVGYRGHWGQRAPGFYNGPTGPITKVQWEAPLVWADEEWHEDGVALSRSTTLLGPSATDAFCGAVARGSKVLTRVTASPLPGLLALGAIALLLVGLARRTTWSPAAPLRLARRRAWGQTLRAALRMYRLRPLVFLGIGVAFVPAMLAATLAQAAIFRLSRLAALEDAAGSTSAVVVLLGVMVGTLLAILALLVVQVATARAMAAIDAEERVTARSALRETVALARGAVPAFAVVVAIITVLVLTVVGIPLAIWLVGRWAFTSQAIALDGLRGLPALRRSARVVHGRWLRITPPLVLAVAIGLCIGPLIGIALLFATSAPFALVNLVSSVVYVAAMPYIAIATTYLYIDADLAQRAPRVPAPSVLPAEGSLGTAG